MGFTPTSKVELAQSNLGSRQLAAQKGSRDSRLASLRLRPQRPSHLPPGQRCISAGSKDLNLLARDRFGPRGLQRREGRKSQSRSRIRIPTSREALNQLNIFFVTKPVVTGRTILIQRYNTLLLPLRNAYLPSDIDLPLSCAGRHVSVGGVLPQYCFP